MKLIKTKNYKEMSKKASEIIIKGINKNPSMKIVFATGKTPLGLYNELVKANKIKQVNFSKIKAFNLDEYYPLKKLNKKSFYYYLHKNLFNNINIKLSNINLLNPETKTPKRECKNYEERIKKNKIDLTILGVGKDGHIAFNEPYSKLDSKTRLSSFNSENMKNRPTKKALTLGIKTILSSRKIILLASGKSKANAIRHLIKDKPNSQYPVTYLKKHKDLIVVIDREVTPLI